MRVLLVSRVVLLTVPAGVALAHDFHAGALGVDHARAAASAPGQHEDPAYLAITNEGNKDDALVGAKSPVAASVELRATMPSGGDGYKERTVESIPVPAHSTIELKPRGYHLTFVSLGYSFAAGERIAATLRFASGAELPVEFDVVEEAAGAAGAGQ